MSYKVLVVGAGPGGVSCSYFIKALDKDQQYEVELIERLNDEKYKIYHDCCGEVISSATINDIKPLQPRGIRGSINKMIEHWPGNINIETNMDGYLINRYEFLHSIIENFKTIGGTFQTGSVKKISHTNDTMKVNINKETKKYDYIVAADGAHSLIRKHIGIKGLVKNYIQYIINEESSQDLIEFFYDEKYDGDYKWRFPHEGQTKIGFPLLQGKSFSPKKPIIKKQTRSIAYGGINQYVHGRILLIGDAACQTNPITKGGIRPAMVAGKLAAQAIIAKKPEEYQKQWIKTDFASTIFLKSYKQLQSMNNEELKHHIKPFTTIDFNKTYKKYIHSLKLTLKFKKYLTLYQAYDLSNKVGW